MEQPSEAVQYSEQQESVPPIEQPLGGGRSQMLLLGLVVCRRRMALSMSFTTVDVPLKLKCRPSLLSRCLCSAFLDECNCSELQHRGPSHRCQWLIPWFTSKDSTQQLTSAIWDINPTADIILSGIWPGNGQLPVLEKMSWLVYVQHQMNIYKYNVYSNKFSTKI
jgi:hypothetical protein